MQIHAYNRKTAPIISAITSSELRLVCFSLSFSLAVFLFITAVTLYFPFEVFPIASLCVSSSLSPFLECPPFLESFV